MSFWLRLLRLLGFTTPEKRVYYLDEELVRTLQLLAEREQRTEDQVAAELISDAIYRRALMGEVAMRWMELTPREQQVAALICQGYGNEEIASHLVLSPNTVKTHVRRILAKFGVSSRIELRLLLVDFDFTFPGGE